MGKEIDARKTEFGIQPEDLLTGSTPGRGSFTSMSRYLPLIALFLFLLPGGCAHAPAKSQAGWEANRRVAVVVAPYWREFPPFAGGLDVIPSVTLARGTPVRFLRNHLGFAEIQLRTLERGWIPRGMLER
jgi:hypothetical protein